MDSIARAAFLTDQFYEWEQRGRGWRSYPHRVALEPLFKPFDRTPNLYSRQPIDDARKPHWLTRAFFHLLNGNPHEPEEQVSDEPSTPDPEVSKFTWVEREWRVSPNELVNMDGAITWLAGQTACRSRRCFEIVGTDTWVSPRIAASLQDTEIVFGQMPAYFPTVSAVQPESTIRKLWNSCPSSQEVVLEFGLGREFMIPLAYQSTKADPLAGVITALANLEVDQMGILQILFEEAENPWGQHIRRAVTTSDGDPFFADFPELTKLAAEKIGSSLYAVVLRIGAKARYEEEAWEILRRVASTLGQFGSPERNEIVPLALESENLVEDLLDRTTHRSGMIWSADELSFLLHPPAFSRHCDRLVRARGQTKAAPDSTNTGELILGVNDHRGRTTPVRLGLGQRLRHTYVIGASGTGKSTLLLNMIAQDLEQGSGLAVLDPHGDLIEQVLHRVPDERIPDVVVFDPSDEEYPIAFNVLAAQSAIEKNLLASDLVAVFRRLSTSWGDQMNSVLANAILAFLESSQGGHLGDLRRFLVDAEYRRDYLKTVDDPEILFYWQKEFPLLTGRPQAPILTRLDAFLRPRLVRNVTCQHQSTLNFPAILDGRKIFLAKLAQGAIGEENSYLLGSLILAKFYQHALSRQQLDEAARQPFYVYVDECHHFVTPSMASILSGARKYKLGLILAHQELRQLAGRDADVAQSALANPGTRICFRVGDDDARKLAEGFSTFDRQDLLNLEVGEAICRVDEARKDFNLRVSQMPEIDLTVAATKRQAIIESSRQKYAVVAGQLEKPLIDWKPRESAKVPSEDRWKSIGTAQAPSANAKQVPSPSSTVNLISPRLPGRGGPAHKYLQELLKRWAEQRGFKVTLEMPVLDGLGFVDVALERDGWRIACEVTVTTGPDHEIGNLQKCLAAGFDTVIVVSPNKPKLKLIEQTVASSLESSLLERVQFLAPEQVFGFLEAEECRAPAVTNVRGYSVKVAYKTTTNTDQAIRRQAIARVVSGTVKKLVPKGARDEKREIKQG